MAKKSSRKSSDEVIDTDTASDGSTVDPEEVAVTTTVEEPTVSKSKTKPADDNGSNGSVGISDIRKAVAFVNSVGGLDKALGLLQILKVAREVQ